jgi:zinc transport system substrate-binding protein
MALALALMLALSGCGDAHAGDANAGDADKSGSADSGSDKAGSDAGDGAKRLSVVASIYPMYDFAKKIGAGDADVMLLIPLGAEPHEWEPTPGDIAALERADVFVYNGLGMEPWADRVLASLNNKSVVACVASENTASGQDEQDRQPPHSTQDPHVWLDPALAKRQLANIESAFARADPSRAEAYGNELEKWSREMDLLGEEFDSARFNRREVFVTHDAFGYMCRAYGLSQVAAVGLSPDAEPEPARMAEVIRHAKASGATTIFYEDNGSPKIAQAIAESIGGKVAALSPVETIGEGELAGGADYFSKMRDNIAALEAALT